MAVTWQMNTWSKSQEIAETIGFLVKITGLIDDFFITVKNYDWISSIFWDITAYRPLNAHSACFMLVSCLAYASSLNMKAIYSSET
jgi:hypothetical protein